MTIISADIITEIKDNGIKIEDMIKYLQSLDNNVLTVGVHADKGKLAVRKAAHTEFGTGRVIPVFPNGWYGTDYPSFSDKQYGFSGKVPPRPAIRMYLYPDMKEGINAEFQHAINREKKTKINNHIDSSQRTLKKVGQESVLMQRDKMVRGGFDQSTNDTGFDSENNGEKTIEYKGFNHPWVQTGETLSNVEYKIKGKGMN